MGQGDGQVHCHGWSAVDTTWSGHDSSANTIVCNVEDSSFSCTQPVGNLTWSGSGTVKAFFPEVCQQDIPPVLHTKAINLACCADLEGPDYVVDAPSVSIAGGTVTLNLEVCPWRRPELAPTGRRSAGSIGIPDAHATIVVRLIPLLPRIRAVTAAQVAIDLCAAPLARPSRRTG